MLLIIFWLFMPWLSEGWPPCEIIYIFFPPTIKHIPISSIIHKCISKLNQSKKINSQTQSKIPYLKPNTKCISISKPNNIINIFPNFMYKIHINIHFQNPYTKSISKSIWKIHFPFQSKTQKTKPSKRGSYQQRVAGSGDERWCWATATTSGNGKEEESRREMAKKKEVCGFVSWPYSSDTCRRYRIKMLSL